MNEIHIFVGIFDVSSIYFAIDSTSQTVYCATHACIYACIEEEWIYVISQPLW